MSFETECKVYIADLDDIHRRLTEAGAVMQKPRIFEQNTRYENQTHTFTINDIVLRLRRDQQVRLTYKAPADNATPGVSTRLELETTVGDYDIADRILRQLGFEPYMIYEKYRTTYELIEEAEIVLDEMPFGVFIEVEGTPEAIDHTLECLGLADAPRIVQSYAELFDLVRDHLNLSFPDLTFDNFAQVGVDGSIFDELA